jgi:Skp family chaperone for outer membrane proteins
MLPVGVSLAQDVEPTAPAEHVSLNMKVGMVDLDVIAEQYRELAARQDELRTWAQTRARFIDQLRNYLFLSEQNFAEVAELLQTPRDKWTDAQVTREEELRKVSEQKEKRFMDLQANTGRTPAEGDEFNSLSDTYEARHADITARATAIEQEYFDKRMQTQASLVSSVREIITKVAEDDKYDLVVDSSMIFYCSDQITDLTALVLESLNSPPEQ